MKLRNTTNSARNTSSIVIIIDSVKEAELKFGQEFTDERIGDSEVMVSYPTMQYLNISDKNKDKIELYFDIVGIIRTLTGHLDDVDESFQKFMPSSYELIEVLQDQYNLNITQDKDLVVDLRDVLDYFFNLTEYSFEVPGLNITSLFPGADLPDLS